MRHVQTALPQSAIRGRLRPNKDRHIVARVGVGFGAEIQEFRNTQESLRYKGFTLLLTPSVLNAAVSEYHALANARDTLDSGRFRNDFGDRWAAAMRHRRPLLTPWTRGKVGRERTGRFQHLVSHSGRLSQAIIDQLLIPLRAT